MSKSYVTYSLSNNASSFSSELLDAVDGGGGREVIFVVGLGLGFA